MDISKFSRLSKVSDVWDFDISLNLGEGTLTLWLGSQLKLIERNLLVRQSTFE